MIKRRKKYQRSPEGEKKRIEAVKKAWLGRKMTKEHINKIVKTRQQNGSYVANSGSFYKNQPPHNKGKTKEDYEPLKRSGNRIKHYKKEGHWNWKGGISTIYDTIKKSPEYIKWRNKIYL